MFAAVDELRLDNDTIKKDIEVIYKCCQIAQESKDKVLLSGRRMTLNKMLNKALEVMKEIEEQEQAENKVKASDSKGIRDTIQFKPQVKPHLPGITGLKENMLRRREEENEEENIEKK